MIIVSQDKKTLVNFDNIAHLFIPEEGSFSNGKYKICYGNLAGSRSDLGEYKTEERAKEVLNEIVQEYSKYIRLEGGPAILQGQIDIAPNIFNIPKVYVMPKE